MKLDGHLFGSEQACFGCGPSHPFGFHLELLREGEEVVTRFTPGAGYQGPPGIMHGGLVTTLADEIAAWTLVALLGKFGFTAALHAKLLCPIRIGAEIEGRGRVLRNAGRVVRVGVLLRQAGADAFEGELTFVLLDKGGAERLIGGPIPESWKPFCR